MITYKEQTAASVPTPATGEDGTFFDSADGLFKYKDDAGAVHTVAEDASPSVTTLADGATITWTVTGKREDVAKVTLGGNRTLAISGAVAGFRGTVLVTQDGTGSRTLALPANSIVRDAGAGVITLSTAAGSKDMIAVVYDGTNYWWTYGVDFT